MFKSALRHLSPTSHIVGALLDIKELVTLALNFTLGGTGIVFAFLQNLPIAIPIGLIVVVVCITGAIVVRIVYRYRKWQRLLELKEPVLQGITGTILDMHLRLTVLAKKQAEHYANEESLPDKYQSIMAGFISMVGLDGKGLDKLIEKTGISEDGVARSQVGGAVKYITKHTKTKALAEPLKNRIPFFVHLGSLLDLQDIGLTRATDGDSRYKGLHNKLRQCRTELAISNRKASWAIDTCLLYSYGLNSFLLHTLLYLHLAKDAPVLPDEHKAYLKQFEQYIEPLFNQVLEDMKQHLVLALIGESP